MLETDGPRSSGVTVRGSGKTYSYDRVFGRDADQGMVYQDVAGHVLDEVLQGYNCTVFAYGQTGTGKTHTMEGDLSAHAGTFATDAGVVPRTLFRLFHILESRNDDFGVRMSFVELYNEELRDLLAESGTALRMYEDPRGRGVLVHGLEDVPLTGAAHGLKLVRIASDRRHVASTRCNDTSSRSHCVFTLTVHVREVGPRGEDVLRVGKLNLVDLAGSENIARSGAENKRAREAGLINQSLLTLGRVINALVDGSAHIPYRESKLTRLLQDSLGGRTKTCIIATVSDDPRNIDETLSTLDYALRAKSIKNRPEANQRMMRAGLIKEYVAEIDHLRADLTATRSKDGVYVDRDNWARREAEQEARVQRIEELQRKDELAQSRLASMAEQLEQNTHVLARRDAETLAAQNVHSERIAALEKALADATERNAALDAAAAARAEAGARAAESLAQYEARLAHVQSDIEGRTHRVHQACAHIGDSIRDVLSALSARVAREHAAQQEQVGACIAECGESISGARRAHARAERDVTALHDGLAELGSRLRDSIGGRAAALEAEFSDMAAALDASVAEHACALQTHAERTAAAARGLAKLTQESLAAQASSAAALHERASHAGARELQRAQRQNERFARALQAEREHGAELRARLVEAVDQYLASRDRRLDGALEAAGAEFGAAKRAAAEDADVFEAAHAAHAEAQESCKSVARPPSVPRADAISAALQTRASAFASSLRGCGVAAAELGSDVDTLGAHVREHVHESFAGVDAALGALGDSVSASLRAVRERLAAADTDASGGADAVHGELVSQARSTGAELEAAAAQLADLHRRFGPLREMY